MNRLIKVTAVFASLMATAGIPAANAGAYSYNGYSVDGSNVLVSDASLGIANEYGGSGLIMLNGSPPMTAFCVDISDYLNWSGSFNTGVDPTTDPNLAGISSITGGSKLADIAALIYNGRDPAAVQLAIWETEYGSGATFIPDDPGLQTEVNAYLTDVEILWTMPSNFALYELTAADGQPNQTLIYLADPPNDVPEPGTFALLGGAVLVTGWLAKRRRPGGAVAQD
jgi:hypothetical protein